jgi:hypothetical protein
LFRLCPPPRMLLAQATKLQRWRWSCLCQLLLQFLRHQSYPLVTRTARFYSNAR